MAKQSKKEKIEKDCLVKLEKIRKPMSTFVTLIK